MKAEIRVVSIEPLPGIRMRITSDPMEALHRFEEVARSNSNLEVRANFEGDGDHFCNVVSFADRHESQHEGLFAMIVYWKRHGRDLQLQVAAHRWDPDPPTYDAYVAAAKRLLCPIITDYNKRFKTRHRMRIESREDLQPKMKPKAKEVFEHFANTANKESLHPLDWEAFYQFVNVCHRTGNFLYEDHVRWFCRRAGFTAEKAEALQIAFFHCYNFLDWFRRGRH